jgi:hypothetical protein
LLAAVAMYRLTIHISPSLFACKVCMLFRV